MTAGYEDGLVAGWTSCMGGSRFAFEHGIPHGGWCPKGPKAEDGPIAAEYLLTELLSFSHPQRTEWNVRDSDGSVIFSVSPILTGGSKKTVDLAIKHNKPWLHLHQVESFRRSRF